MQQRQYGRTKENQNTINKSSEKTKTLEVTAMAETVTSGVFSAAIVR